MKMYNKTKSNLFLLPLIVLTLILISGMVSAQLLVSVSTDKTEFNPNEMGWFFVKVYNDSPESISNIILKIEAEEGLNFIKWNEETSFIIEDTGTIEKYFSKEYKYKIRLGEDKTGNINLFAYYGEKSPLNNVAGTFITGIESKISAVTKIEMENTPQGDKVITTLKLSNDSGEPIGGIAVQPIMPEGFTLVEPQFLQMLEDKNSVIFTFESIAPPKIQGEKIVTITYGYLDRNTPHYFEKYETISYQRDTILLLVIGFIVLAAAVYLLIQKMESEEKNK